MTKIDFSKYQRMFEWNDYLYFLITSIFVEHYKRFDLVTFSNERLWSSHLSLKSKEKTLIEGVNIYGNDINHKKYLKDFKNYIEESKKFFEIIVKKEIISKAELKIFFKYSTECFYHYSKTEFFYTDLAFKKMNNDNIIKESFKDFEQLKLRGREYMNSIILGKDSYLFKTIEILSKQLNVDKEYIWACNQIEALDIFNNKFVDDTVINKRRKSYLIKTFDNKVDYYYDGIAENNIETYLKSKTEGKTLKGQIASRGKVIGRAKVFIVSMNNFSELHKEIDAMNRGDILVAETTAPEIIAACNKASAIVTNQGGMMSHAAIVSRELKIPCIVGTGNATQLLKDGDKVEVDAGKGVVKILSRKNDK